ncbi:MAG TPA: hypothetical protein IAA05_06285 [Candidatus Blautia excrementipullorum]|nr:hypothetical protein CLOM621_08071 [Clostridium sp. M62/1]HJB15633.1 hypothetical protein [Candidatus Blautia excrementipullorum]
MAELLQFFHISPINMVDNTQKQCYYTTVCRTARLTSPVIFNPSGAETGE